jgi:hypothetical protein
LLFTCFFVLHFLLLEKGYGLLVFLLGLLVFYRELLTVSETIQLIITNIKFL